MDVTCLVSGFSRYVYKEPAAATPSVNGIANSGATISAATSESSRSSSIKESEMRSASASVTSDDSAM